MTISITHHWAETAAEQGAPSSAAACWWLYYRKQKEEKNDRDRNRSQDGPEMVQFLGETEAPWQQDWQLNTVADRLISHGRKKKKKIKKSKRKFHTPLRVKEKTTSLTQRLVVFHHFSKVYFHSQTICFFQLKAFNIWSFSQKQYRYG